MSVDRPDASVDLFETLFTLIPDLAAIIGPGGLFKRINPSWEGILGYAPEELLDRPLADFFHPDDRGPTFGALGNGSSGRPTAGFVNRCRCKDGSYKWIEWETAPAPDESLVLVTGKDIMERRLAQEKMEGHVRHLSTIYNIVSDVLFLLAVEPADRFRFVSVNRRFLEMTGLKEYQVVGQYVRDVIPEPALTRVLGYYREAINNKTSIRWEELSTYPAGAIYGEVRIDPVYDENSRCTNIVGTVRDLSERAQSILEKAKLEDQLRQAQKLESIGRLAGGIAHDFNNLLTVIMGYCEFLQKSLSPEEPIQEYVTNISKAGETAANLTKQLLAFSRKQVIKPKPLNLNTVVSDTGSMLQRLIGEDISLVTSLSPSLGWVMGDPDQVRQVLVNLAANARDAMPDGGELFIETTEVLIDEDYVHGHPEAAQGHCVLMTVNDTGFGMDADIRQNVFEPFFTTKEPGKGTGLGLATVYGIIHQFSGWIEVESAPGCGAKFRIYLPRLEGEFPLQPDPPLAAGIRSGSETILLVEDERAVRQLAADTLTSHGYSVITASCGDEAIDLASSQTGKIHLMVTDIVMPGMNGRELAERLKAVRPDLKVLFTSGYTPDAIARPGLIGDASTFLAKPFTPTILVGRVREILTNTQV